MKNPSFPRHGANFTPRFEEGEIVYWCVTEGAGNTNIKYGMVDFQDGNIVSVDYLCPADRRLVNGIPIDEFEPEQRRKKLPKGWTYNTRLFEMSERPWTEAEKNAVSAFNYKHLETIKAAYEAGVLVKECSIFNGRIETDIDRHSGWRLVKKYLGGKATSMGVSAYKLHRDYASAEEELNEIRNEFEWQASLSDEEWSKYTINENLSIYKYIRDKTEYEIDKIRNFLFSLPNIKDVETRGFGDHFEWKYLKNKKWNAIVEETL